MDVLSKLNMIVELNKNNQTTIPQHIECVRGYMDEIKKVIDED